ncbi:hypothetical protein ACFFF5_11310 [Lederbergia wuyishanensis]|uniref:Uncharacterized protein n=1 Tax=Lederbergia wuyishanensis TaxID=1347903 RepID=A0ABU0D467_9BACI|nr:hypothetical protein [Lederbergia wuyishanensis]MCJ8008217.1 hypothetical protein [Lederbergia wuyishanensis]MDQ0343194.1 hypothetical protein [Lederbergia wuyishanensis]
MIEIISTYKWHLLITMEVLFWIAFITFLVLKYWFETKAKVIFLAFTIIFECLDLPLAVMDYVNTGRISFFQITILLVYFYALTFGNQNVQKLDLYIKRKIMELKGKPLPIQDKRLPSIQSKKEYAKSVKQGFLLHVSVFLVIHILLLIEFAWPPLTINYISDLLSNDTKDIFHNTAINRASIMWSLFLLINGFVAFLYTYSPWGIFKNK